MIAKQAGEQLAPVLHRIVPKLYRYQFDPNPKIQAAMTSIWTALVTDQKNTVSAARHLVLFSWFLVPRQLVVVTHRRPSPPCRFVEKKNHASCK